MQVLNASHHALVAGGKNVDPPTDPAPPLLRVPKPWPWFPSEP